MNSYILLGHGMEDVDEERQTVPEGITLVTLSECGFEVIDRDVYRMMDFLNDNPDIIQIPERIPTDFPVRIYTSGMEYPTLMLSPLLDFQLKSGKTGLEKSGVYSLPTPFRDLYVEDISLKYGLFIDNSTGVIEKVYEGAVYPPITWLDNIKRISGSLINIQLLQKEIPVSVIFESLGPGIYYFTSCRSLRLPYKHGYVRQNTENTNTAHIAENMLRRMKLSSSEKKEIQRKLFAAKQIIRPRSANTQRQRKKPVGGALRHTRHRVRKFR